MSTHSPASPGPPPPTIASDTLPRVRTDLAPAEVLERLGTLSRRGRLPGFQRGGRVFSVEAHGHPFDAEVIAEAMPASPGAGELRFRMRLHRRMPVIFAVVLLATIWPGAYFMDQLMPGEWGWVSTKVYWWYLPVTVVPIPWIWRGMMRKSRESNRREAEGAIKKIAAEIGGTVEN